MVSRRQLGCSWKRHILVHSDDLVTMKQGTQTNTETREIKKHTHNRNGVRKNLVSTSGSLKAIYLISYLNSPNYIICCMYLTVPETLFSLYCQLCQRTLTGRKLLPIYLPFDFCSSPTWSIGVTRIFFWSTKQKILYGRQLFFVYLAVFQILYKDIL